jgi:cytochrome c
MRRDLIATRIGIVVVAGVAASFAASSSYCQTLNDSDLRAGHELYVAKCGGCHSIDQNRIGPMHRNLLGRRIASVPGFNYSPAIKRLAGVWTRERLDKWLQDPQSVAPGTAMYFSLDDAEQRRLVIEYLASESKVESGMH